MSRRLAYLLAAALACAALPAHAAEQILRFDSVVAVAPDGELTVTETIRVRAEGRDIQIGRAHV